MTRSIDLNSDLGEGYGPWSMGDDAAMLALVSSVNIACGGHAGDPETMHRTLRLAGEQGVIVGAHPGYNDREGFGRRVIPMAPDEVGRVVAAQVGALRAIAATESIEVRYVKPHGALGNLAAADGDVARALVSAIHAVDERLAILAISGTMLEQVARDQGVLVYSEIFADRAYLASGQLVPRTATGAVLHDVGEATERLLGFLETGLMPVIDGEPIPLDAHSICVHGDSPGALEMTRRIRDALAAHDIELVGFAAAR